ncbi:hypothetical protein C8Q80DRAFT_556667 [Daedaleopsis nitida]|nr:hypothetical protein C8Q80DRAFT_556667 [Daedaleopsis nitida]
MCSCQNSVRLLRWDHAHVIPLLHLRPRLLLSMMHFRQFPPLVHWVAEPWHGTPIWLTPQIPPSHGPDCARRSLTCPVKSHTGSLLEREACAQPALHGHRKCRQRAHDNDTHPVAECLTG